MKAAPENTARRASKSNDGRKTVRVRGLAIRLAEPDDLLIGPKQTVA